VTPLPRYVPGTTDRRDFSVDGCSFHVERSPDYRGIGFWGQGRDGDYVPASMREPDVLAKLVEGFAGLQPRGLGYRVDSDDVLDRIERMMVERCVGYSTIYREVRNDHEAAAALLALPREPGMKRTVHVSGPGPFVMLNLTPEGDGVNPGTNERVPAEQIPARYAAALAGGGPHDVRVIDSP
jgi:hypothetical protein